MHPLTAEEFITALAGAPITLSPEPPKDLLQEGEIFVWPSKLAQNERVPGRLIEAVVFDSTEPGHYIMVMVTPRIYEALGGTL